MKKILTGLAFIVTTIMPVSETMAGYGHRYPDDARMGKQTLECEPRLYTEKVKRNIEKYILENTDIGITPVFADDAEHIIRGYDIWARMEGAGYSLMFEDICDLAKAKPTNLE